ncbi:MAG TPA: hypothetical protein PKY05_10505 [Fibrobacteria bacterium]|nr:hypothetical protein [Fibrobacteria bacterium]
MKTRIFPIARGLSVAALLVFQVPAQAVEGIDLSGTVYDASGKGAFGIQVGLRNAKLSTMTTPDGNWKLACATCPVAPGGDSLELRLRDSVLEVSPLASLNQSGLVKVLGQQKAVGALQASSTQTEIAQHQAERDFAAMNTSIKTSIDLAKAEETTGRHMKYAGWVFAGLGAATLGYAMNSSDELTQIIAGGIGGGFVGSGVILIPISICAERSGAQSRGAMEREARSYPRIRNAAKNLDEARWIDSAQGLRNMLAFQTSQVDALNRNALMGFGVAAAGTGAAFYGASLFTGVNVIVGATPGAAVAFPFLIIGITSAADPMDVGGATEKTRARLLKMQEEHPFVVQPSDTLLMWKP